MTTEIRKSPSYTKNNYKLKGTKRVEFAEALRFLHESGLGARGFKRTLIEKINELIDKKEVPSLIEVSADMDKFDTHYLHIIANQINSSLIKTHTEFRIKFLPVKKAYIVVPKAMWDQIGA